MLYMMCRKDAVDRTIKTSELFPVLVEGEDLLPEEIVLKALQDKWPDYTPKNKAYYVIPMAGAKLVTFKPKVDYEIIVRQVVPVG